MLSAVFASEDPAKGLAIIGESAQKAKVFGVGSMVRPGIKLHSVYIDKVILDRGGNLEALSLPKRNSAALVINRPPPPQQNQVAENLRRIAETNPSAFAEIIRPQPVFAEWRPARLSRLPRSQSRAVQQAGSGAGRSGALDQRHAAG